jgi:7-cyano-7-deazaguanine synthase in queuosine biosynthesis
MTKAPKFTKKEKAKVEAVLQMLEARLDAELTASGSCYSNTQGCGNCGDTGPFYGTLYDVRKLVGLK